MHVLIVTDDHYTCEMAKHYAARLIQTLKRRSTTSNDRHADEREEIDEDFRQVFLDLAVLIVG